MSKLLSVKIRQLLSTGEYESGCTSRRIRITPEQREKLTEHAVALESINAGTEPKTILGRWARARRLWCEITGEPLL